jgi:hypothetical protein
MGVVERPRRLGSFLGWQAVEIEMQNKKTTVGIF